MPLITEVVDAMRSAQEAGLKVLAYVIPIDPVALDRSGLAAATIEDRVRTVMIRELKACLGGETTIGQETDLPDGRPVWLTDRELEDIIYCLKKQLPPYDRRGTSSVMPSS